MLSRWGKGQVSLSLQWLPPGHALILVIVTFKGIDAFAADKFFWESFPIIDHSWRMDSVSMFFDVCFISFMLYPHVHLCRSQSPVSASFPPRWLHLGHLVPCGPQACLLFLFSFQGLSDFSDGVSLGRITMQCLGWALVGCFCTSLA